MSNKRITDLTELTTPTTDDVFPVVDIATNTTTKVQLGNLPVTTAVTTALATKQDTLVSGTNIKTVNSTSLVGSGNVAVQETLVSGTNIKTLNSVSLLGSGNIVLAATPSGVAGAIQFSNGSAFASDAANLFWDDTNNRLGVGTNAPSGKTQIITDDATSPFAYSSQLTQLAGSALQGLLVGYSATNGSFISSVFPGTSFSNMTYTAVEHRFSNAGAVGMTIHANGNTTIGNGTTTLSARVGIKGSGSTSATTSLLVQNSSGSTAMEVKDNLTVGMGGAYVSSPSGFGTTVASITALYPCFLMNSTGGGGSKVGLNIDTAKLYFSEETSGAVYGHRIMADTRIGGLAVKNDTAAGATASLNASAVLQADSTTKGFLPPRMTTTQKNAIASPAAGLVVYDSTTNKLCCYNGSTWNDLF
jgi:hypothetical protein